MKSRNALSLPPTFETLTATQDAYLPSLKLRPLAREHKRYWAFHGVPTTVALPGNRYAKSLDSFPDHNANEDSFRSLLAEYSDNGVVRPSGYADVFHERFESPRVNWSVNSRLAPCFAGGWQSAIHTGVHRGVYHKYDMRSAYMWSATLGLPSVRTYRRSLRSGRCSDSNGLFRIRLVAPTASAPFPFNQAKECIATAEEIDTYGLQVAEIVEGVTWSEMESPDKILEAIRSTSTWKQAGRCYWGRWGQQAKIECVAGAKRWQLPNTKLNIPWAHLIISRVKMKLWTYSKNALHVYVDSVITPDVIPIGDGIGDWKLEKTYNGVIVRGTGQYGALDDVRLERMAGVGKTSPQRAIAHRQMQMTASNVSIGE